MRKAWPWILVACGGTLGVACNAILGLQPPPLSGCAAPFHQAATPASGPAPVCAAIDAGLGPGAKVEAGTYSPFGPGRPPSDAGGELGFPRPHRRVGRHGHPRPTAGAPSTGGTSTSVSRGSDPVPVTTPRARPSTTRAPGRLLQRREPHASGPGFLRRRVRRPVRVLHPLPNLGGALTIATVVARYDTTGELQNAASWASFDVTTMAGPTADAGVATYAGVPDGQVASPSCPINDSANNSRLRRPGGALPAPDRRRAAPRRGRGRSPRRGGAEGGPPPATPTRAAPMPRQRRRRLPFFFFPFFSADAGNAPTPAWASTTRPRGRRLDLSGPQPGGPRVLRRDLRRDLHLLRPPDQRRLRERGPRAAPAGRWRASAPRPTSRLPSSWTFFDVTNVQGNASGFVGGAFDGRYLYLVLHAQSDRPALRHDGPPPTSRPLLRLVVVRRHPKWSAWTRGRRRRMPAGAFDGRFVYLVPSGRRLRPGPPLRHAEHLHRRLRLVHGGSRLVPRPAKGNAGTYNGAVFDGEYLYLIPNGNTLVARFRARTPASMPALPQFHGSFW